MELITGIVEFLKTIISLIMSKDKTSEFSKNYDDLRFDIATALAMYAQYYHNPVDLARMPDQKLPPKYAEASEKIRVLASKTRALSQTLPDKEKNAEIKSRLHDISACLFGLSNSFITPFNCGITTEHQRYVDEYEREIKKILKLSSGR